MGIQENENSGKTGSSKWEFGIEWEFAKMGIQESGNSENVLGKMIFRKLGVIATHSLYCRIIKFYI